VDIDMASNTEHAESHNHPTLATYIAVFVALLLLLVATVVAAEWDVGRWNFVVAVAIASLKAALILLFFMHVRYSPPLIWLFVFSGFYWMAIMFALTLSDYITRVAQ
jgi:cytochrome c oxidase subunit IV